MKAVSTLPIGGIDHTLRVRLTSAVLANAVDLELTRSVKKYMKCVFPIGKVIRSAAPYNYAPSFICCFNENRTRKIAHLVAVEIVGAEYAALCSAAPEQPAYPGKERIGMFIKLFDSFDVDLCHFGDVKDQ